MHSLTRFPGRRPALIIGLLTSAMSVPASAQFGALRRAAERRVEQKVDDQANIAMLIEPTFDNTTIPITTERLDRYLDAMSKKGAAAAAARAANESAMQRASKTRDSARAVDRPAERETYMKNIQRYNECRDGVREALDDAARQKTETMAAQMQANPMGAQNDPKMKEIVAAMQELAAAQSRGDAAGVQRIQARMAAMMGVVSDSAEIDKRAASKCGARPVKPAFIGQSDALTTRADSIERAASGAAGAGNGVPGSAVGMTDVQSRMMWERMQSWLSGMRKDAPITVTFTRAEYDLLVSRRRDIRKAFAGAE